MNQVDKYLHKNDYISAEKYLLECLDTALENNDSLTQILLYNELMGLYRKLGRREEAINNAETALRKIRETGAENQVGSATTYLNCATVYKAFGMAEKGLPLYRKAQSIYEEKLPANDSRLGGLYNNMGLTLVDLKEFSQAYTLYEKAVAIMLNNHNGAPEAAITYLNLANAVEADKGLLQACTEIDACLDKAQELLESHGNRDGNYAFVCEKCASVFLYYGRFAYGEELAQRARRIYEGS